MANGRRRTGWTFLVTSSVLGIAAIVLSVSLGPVRVPLAEILRIIIYGITGLDGVYGGPESWKLIILELRLPVALMGALVGASLSASGASLQGLFRNDLADPFIIGISAGGALGWIVGSLVSQDWSWIAQTVTRLTLSFALGLTSVLVAYGIARRGSRVPIANMLLAGVAVSALLTSFAQVLIYLFVENPAEMIFSLMGGLGNTRWFEVAIVAPAAIGGITILAYLGTEVNAFAAGEEAASHLGVSVERSKALVIGLSALVTAVTIPFCGVIGFVGLMVPHITRRFVGPDHRVLVPASALLGAGFLVACDILTRTITQAVIPLGMVTGMIGGGFFLYLLTIRRRT